VDWSNIAEEIESLGKSDQRELRNRVRTILTHLIKLQASPAAEPRAGWRATILEQRAELRVVLDDSPSLKPTLASVISRELPAARDLALAALVVHREQPSTDPAGLSYTEDEVMGPWLP
jgi:hypothetical protein